MRTTIYLTVLLIVTSLPVSVFNSQALTTAPGNLPIHYVYHGKPKELRLNTSLLAVRYTIATSENQRISSAGSVDVLTRGTESVGIGEWYLLHLKTSITDLGDANGRVQKLLSSHAVSFASPVFLSSTGDWITMTDELLVRCEPFSAAHAQQIFSEFAPPLLVIHSDFGNMQGAYVLRSTATNGFDVLAIANRLALDSRIAWAEPNAIFSGRAELVPNDPGFPNLWGILNTGQYSGIPNQDVDGDEAWDITTGSDNVKVLIIDVGVQQDHPDIHQLGGYDVTGQNGGGGPVNQCDNHGTPVAGCVSAIINNSLGTVGVAPDCRCLSVRTFISSLSCNGSWTTSANWTVDALTWGESQGARVSNNSNCYGFASNAIDAKYETSRVHGMVHFASAGNNGTAALSYPASSPAVNAIAALGPTGTRATFSQYGNGLDFSAPGVNIHSTDRTGTAGYYSGDYGLVHGTSFASPYAAGVAAMVLSRNGALTAPEVETRLQTSSRDLGTSGYGTDYGWGFVNALNAVRHATLAYEISVVNQQSVAGNAYQFDVIIRNTGTTDWRISNTTLELEYDSTAFSRPAIEYVTGSTQLGAAYIVSPTLDRTTIRIQIVAMSDFSTLSTVSPEGTRIGTFIISTMLDPATFVGLAWRIPIASYQRILEGVSNGLTNTLTPLATFVPPDNSPLPITLASFTATYDEFLPGMELEWITLNEINNYGFYPQKRVQQSASFKDIPRSFTPGHGTTNIPHRYSYHDLSTTTPPIQYRLKQLDLDGTVHFSRIVAVYSTTQVVQNSFPTTFHLYNNFPNPCNPTTMIRYSLPHRCHVQVRVYDILGKEVATLVEGIQPAGQHDVKWDVTNVPSGIYVYSLEAGSLHRTQKLIVAK